MRWLVLYLCLMAAAAHAEDQALRVTPVHKIIASQNVWLNTSRKIEPEDLKGRIILLDFWTLGCINCMDVIPDLKYLEHTFGDQLTVIGVHSAKFENERDTENIKNAIVRYGLVHPVVNDADFSIWKQFGVRAWPTFVLINPAGTIERVYEGEGNREAVEADVNNLLIKYKGRINTAPLPIALESSKLPDTVLRFPEKIIALGSNRLAIADSGHNRIVIAELNGEIDQVIGSGTEGLKDGSFDEAQFFKPQGMAYQDGMLYIADTNNHVLRLADLTKQTVTTLAGTGKQDSGREPKDSPALELPLSSPWDVAFYPDADTLTIAMAGKHQLWTYDIKQHTLSLLAGNGTESIDDGRLPSNSLSQPSGLSAPGDKLYFTDAETSALRVLARDGSITTLIGTGLFDFGYKEGTREGALMQHCLALVADGNDIYIADTYNHSIRRYDIKEKTLHNFAGHDARGVMDGALADATFNEPGGITKLGDILYVADTNNNLIRTIDLKEGVVKMLDVAPKPADAAAATPPNLQTLAFSVAANTPTQVAFALKDGWHINKDAPSRLELFSDTATKNPFKVYSKESLQSGPVTFSLAAGYTYHLRGTIYYCEDKANSLCMIKSFDVKLTTDGKDSKIALPLNGAN